MSCPPEVPPTGYSYAPPEVLLCDEYNCRTGSSGCREVTGYIRDLGNNPGYPAFHNRISSIVIPPNTNLKVANQIGGASSGSPLILNNKVKIIRGPKTITNLNLEYWPSTTQGMNDQIRSVEVSSQIPHKEWLRQCCLGEISPSSDCVNYADPKGPDCQNLMREHCTSSPTAFFGSKCKQYLQGLNSSIVNELAGQMCVPPYQNRDQEEWCACFDISTAPANLSETTKGLWPCLQQTCNDSSKALQRFPGCSNNIVICDQKEIVAELNESAAGAVIVKNECGNVNLGTDSPGGGGGGGEGTQPPAVINNTGVQPVTIYILSGVFLVVLILVVTLATSKKGK